MTSLRDTEPTHRCVMPSDWDMRDACPGATWTCRTCHEQHVLTPNLTWAVALSVAVSVAVPVAVTSAA